MNKEKLLDEEFIPEKEQESKKWHKVILIGMFLFGLWLFRENFNDLYYCYIDGYGYDDGVVGLLGMNCFSWTPSIDTLIIRIVSGLLLMIASVLGFFNKNRSIGILWILSVFNIIFSLCSCLWDVIIYDYVIESYDWMLYFITEELLLSIPLFTFLLIKYNNILKPKMRFINLIGISMGLFIVTLKIIYAI